MNRPEPRTQHPAPLSRRDVFHRHPGLTLIAVNAVAIAFIAAISLAAIQAVRADLKRGVKRYVALRENRPLLDQEKVPSDLDMRLSDSLEKKPYRFRIDADGYILPSRVHERPDFSVVFLGGSTTECGHNEEDKRFPYLAGRILERETGRKVNAYNHGVSGSNSLHSLNALLNKVLPLRPDACVLMHNYNDLLILLHERDYWNTNAYKGQVRVMDDPRNVRTFGLWVGNVLRQGRDYLYWLLGRAHAVDEFESARGRELDVDEKRITERFAVNLRMFVDICRDNGIVPVLMTQFNRFADPPDRLVKANLDMLELKLGLDQAAFVSLYRAMNRTVRRVARERGTLLIDLDRTVPKTNAYLFDEIHLNTNGSTYVAELVAKALATLPATRP